MATKQQPIPTKYSGFVDYRHVGCKHGSGVGFGADDYATANKDAVHNVHYYLNLGDCKIERAVLWGVCPICDGQRGTTTGKRVRKWHPCKGCNGEGTVTEQELDVMELVLQADPGSRWA